MPKRSRKTEIKEENKENDESGSMRGSRRSKRIKNKIPQVYVNQFNSPENKFKKSKYKKSDSEFKSEFEPEYKSEPEYESEPEPEPKSSGRSQSGRGSKYSKKARTTLTRGVKSCHVDKAKMVSIKFNEAIPVDIECPLFNSHKVAKIGKGKEYYDVMLNQTNIASNNNKYYILQLLERREATTTGTTARPVGPALAVWFRWGRVGHINGTMLKEYENNNRDDAINDFGKKFYDKTKNTFDDIIDGYDFVKCNNKYDLVRRDYHDVDEVKDEVKTEVEVKIEPCQLDENIQNLIEMISDISMMENQVKEMKFDIQKAPLGKLGQDQISRGFGILKKIENQIKSTRPNTTLTKLSSEYYTHIPHDFGFR